MLQSTAGQPPNEHFIDFIYQPTHAADGTVSGIFVHGIDWTERKRAQTDLLESEGRLREVTNAMPQIVWTARPDGQVDYWNQRWYDYTGAQPGTFGDASWQDIVHPEDAALVAEVWPKSLASGEPYELEIRIREAATGAYRWFLGRATPTRDAAGKIVRWIGTNTDVDEQRQLRQQNEALLTSERAARSEAERISHVKDEFLATLSHELRTPLNAILGWTQVLRGDPANTEDMEAGLATIERNSRAQTQIIEDLLDMSKIISGKVRLDVQPLQLDQVVVAGGGHDASSRDGQSHSAANLDRPASAHDLG